MEVRIMDFKKAVKLLHPDVNPDIDDPANKLGDILKFRDDKRMIYRLMESWDLVGKEDFKTVDRFEEKSNKSTSTPVVDDVIRIGSSIRVITKNDIICTVTKITAKRYYFILPTGQKSFCSKKNAVKQTLQR